MVGFSQSHASLPLVGLPKEARSGNDVGTDGDRTSIAHFGLAEAGPTWKACSFPARLVLVVALYLSLGCGRKPVTTISDGTSATSTTVSSDLEGQVDSHAAAYVGDHACRECHENISEQFAGHSMGRSLAEVTAATELAGGDGGKFEADGFRYAVTRASGQIFHRQSRIGPVGEEVAIVEEPVKFVVGSGNHGQSFLVDRGGYLFMSPITWYPDKQIWDLSPGYEEKNSEFNRPVVASCLFCHSNQYQHLADTLNHYGTPTFVGHAIGCERCHGPGEQHVSIQQSGGLDADRDTIVNPAKLSPDLREAICQQCHLSGAARVQKPGRTLADFVPGEPLESAFTVFTLRADLETERKFVGHVEQMYASPCFQKSEGRMGCLSCHDPHSLPAPEEKTAYYRNRCLQCHEEDACHLNMAARRDRSAEDNCVACHMPAQQTEIRHAATTDHSIPRSPDQPRRAISNVSNADLPVVVFPPSSTAATPRDSAIAIVRASMSHTDAIDSAYIDQAMSVLERVMAKDPDDVEAIEMLCDVYLSIGQADKAARACLATLQRRPKREQTLTLLAGILSQSGSHAQAIQYWRRAIEVNPWMSRYWYNLAKSYAGVGQWEMCRQVCAEAVRRFPTSVGARHLLVECQLRAGDPQAEATFAELEQFQPKGLQQLRDWFERHPLRAGVERPR